MRKNVLVIGSGGREHALTWKLSQSAQVAKIYVAPGNGGTDQDFENVNIDFIDIHALLDFAKKNAIDLTVVGQEASSEAGVVDLFKNNNLKIFGPTKKSAQIETSKAFSKDLMKSENIPTAIYKTFSKSDDAIKYAISRPLPVVIKADGLATGKGVTVAENYEQAKHAIKNIMVKKVFGDSGNNVVIEDFLKGSEVSIHALCDGKNTALFPSSQDYKQAYDGDKGPNTGGLGAIAPVPWVSPEHMKTIENRVVKPALAGLADIGAEFQGCLYPGLMIENNDINVVEFNSRFGDPEAEVYVRLFEGDLYQVLHDCAIGHLNPKSVKWSSGFAVTVVLASGGYPGKYETNMPIAGLEKASDLDDVVIFHSGTKLKNNQPFTSGGRVLNVTATGITLKEAIDKAYQAVKLISFKNMHYRADIGKRNT